MAEENYQTIIEEGFTRVERDNRLLDVFPDETSEHGVQLWEKWTDTEVTIIRIHDSKNTTRHVFLREKTEDALKNNSVLKLL